MKRFFTRIYRFFWSWAFLKFLLFAITLVLLLYAEEDWRGARAWAATKAKWEALGVSFDFNTYLPPPVPDDQNLAALPIFKLEPDPDPDPERHGYLVPLTLQRAFAHNETNSVESHGNWEEGKLNDMAKLRASVTAQYRALFPGHVPPAGVAAQFAELYPIVAELREASATHPFCRFEQNYKFEPDDQNEMSSITEQIQVSKFLTWDALLALDARDTGRALEDIQLNNKLTRGLMDQPMLVSGLVAIGMTAINFGAVYDGLAVHAWTDGQLDEIEGQLAQLDFLGDYQRAMRGEPLLMIPMIEKMKASSLLWSKGWSDIWKAQMVDMDLTASTWTDPKSRRMDPQAVADYQAELNRRLDRWTVYLPWNWLLRMSPADAVFHTPWKFARMQVWTDQARIACALERYRLAHNAYPPTLDALVPACIEALPHDVMNGEPYHYRLNADGTFLLYSVGWNQQDDGGKVVMKPDNPNAPDYAQGDWVWPTPKR